MSRVFPYESMALPLVTLTGQGTIGAGAAGFTPEAGFGLSGTLTDDSTITVTGTNFGTKPHGDKPWLYAELGLGQTDIGSDSRGTWATNWNPIASIATNSVAPNRTHSLELAYDDDGAMNQDGWDMNAGSTKTELYTMHRYMTNVDGADLYADKTRYNVKFQRIWNATKTHDIFAPACAGTTGGPADGKPRMAVEVTNASTNYYSPMGTDRVFMGFQKNKWITDEWVLTQGTLDTDDATWDHIRDGYVHSGGPEGDGTFTSRTTANPELYTELYWAHVGTNTGITSSYKIFYDFVYADDSHCRIIISEEDTWDAATVNPESIYIREPQIPLTWTDTSVTFKLRSGILGDLAGHYLYVVASDNIAQKIGVFT